MNKTITLTAEPRTVTGRKVKALRREKKLPINLYSKNTQSISLTVDYTTFTEVFDQAGETGVIDLKINGDSQSHPALIAELQYDPLTERVIHADLRQVDLTQKITAHVPVEIIGESPAVKEHNATIVVSLDEIEVEALPQNLPEKFEVDISVLVEVGSNITVSQLATSDKVEILTELDTVIVSAQEQQQEEAPAETGETTPTEAVTTEQGTTPETDKAE